MPTATATTIQVTASKTVTVPAGTIESRAKFLFGTVDEERTTRRTLRDGRARVVSYDPSACRALVDYALGGCGTFATIEGVRMELDGVELPEGQVPSYTKASDGRNLPTVLRVREGKVVAAPSVFGEEVA